MSQLDHVQLTSIISEMNPLFTSFQTLGDTTNLPALVTAQGKPVSQAGDGTHNPIGLIDNRKTRATTILLMIAATAANNVKVAFDVIGFSKVVNQEIYLPTRFFLGEAQAGNISLATSTGTASSFLCDNFTLKTFAGFNVAYIEPADDIGGAILLCDIRGCEYATVRFAQGAATAATKVMAWYGVN